MNETIVDVPEDIGQRELCASVMSGQLAREVIVMVIYEDRNALSELGFFSQKKRLLTFIYSKIAIDTL